MTAEDLIVALDLPVDSRDVQRIPKKMLADYGAPTASDRRQITDNIEELMCLAILKPATVGVPTYCDETREYLELPVVSVSLRRSARIPRLTELIHRAIAYPVILIATYGNSLSLSLAHKRWSQNEKDTIILDGEILCAELSGTPPESEFLAALALSVQPRTDLRALYQGWIDAVIALHAAHITGTFLKSATPQHAESRRVALQECHRQETEIAQLSAAASREKQLPKRVELNLRIQSLRESLNAAKGFL